jgi:acyl carrier protein
LTVGELRNFLKRSLPHDMLPASYVFMKSFPMMSNGKLDRKALPVPEIIRPELIDKYVAPRNDLERRLADAWTQVLELDRVGIRDNFFDLGGTSLTSVEVVVRLKEAGLTITPEMLFEHQTVAELAAAIEAGGTERNA